MKSDPTTSGGVLVFNFHGGICFGRKGILWLALSVLGTFVWVACRWIPFRADSFAHAKTIFLQMFVWDDGVFFVSVWSLIYGGLLLVVGGVALVLWKRRLRKVRETATPDELPKMIKAGVETDDPIMDINKLSSLTILMIFVYLILCFARFGHNPFVCA